VNCITPPGSAPGVKTGGSAPSSGACFENVTAGLKNIVADAAAGRTKAYRPLPTLDPWDRPC
jgi:hypothetical protein